MAADAQRDFFDRIARPFRARYDERPAFRQRRALFAEVGRAALARSPGRRCLDLGCGPGVLAGDLAQLGFEVTGVDASPAMIEEAKRQAPAHARFVARDVLEFLRDEQEPAALVVSSSVLEYLREPAALVRRVAELLEPGGTFAFSIPNQRSLLRRVEPLLQRDRYREHWQNRLSLADYLELARELKLRVQLVRHFGFPGRVLGPLSGASLVGTLTLVVLARP